MVRTNILRLTIGLLAVATVSASVVPCSSNNYSPTDTDEQCFPFVADPEWAFTPDVGQVCISVEGSVMSLTYSIDNPDSTLSIFNTQVFVGASIDDIPRDTAGQIDATEFNVVSDEYTGVQSVTVQVQLGTMVDTCELAIMPHSKLGAICADPEAQGEPLVNWLRNSDMVGTAGDTELSDGDDGDYYAGTQFNYLTMTINCQCEDDEPDPNPAPPKEVDPSQPTPSPRNGPDPTPKTGSSSGDPHFKTWTGEKYDYHGECDLVLVDNPAFADGLGLQVHIRTTAVKYFSFIEKVAVQIGTDVLEFDNDVENFLINGVKVEKNRKYHKTHLGGYLVRRDKKAISIVLDKQGNAKIDLHTRKNGFPSVIVDGGTTDIFKGSLGLLGDWATGKRLARDRKTELNGHDGTAFALEWQVSDKEPVLFADARFPQFPTSCTPPAKRDHNRLGFSSFEKEAEKACAHWKEDKDDCIFDVIATRDVLVAADGHLVHVE